MRGVVTLVFDDGYAAILERVVPILNQYKLPGVFAIPTDTVALEKKEGMRIASVDQWQAVVPQGHELAAHSKSHADLTSLPLSQLLHELAQPQTALNSSTLVYPGGAANQTVIDAAKRYYTAARTVTRGYESIPPQDPWRLKTFNYHRHNFTLFKANIRVLWACLTNRWLIETFHLIDDTDRGMVHQVSLQTFQRHLAFIASLPIQVKTIKQVIQN